MKSAAVLALLLASCSAREVGNALLPDELTLGQGEGTSSLDGKLNTHWGYDSWDSTYEGETESTYAALTWHLPSLEDDLPRKEREDLRSRSIILDQQAAELIEEETETLGSGATFEADARHASIFASIIGLLLVFLLIKLRRSNGWH